MNEEWFAAIALPVSVAEDAQTHATIFLSPKLTPDHEGAVLGEFELFAHWGAVARDRLRLTLVDQDGEIPTDADVSAVAPDLWELAFGEDTPVGVNRVPEWQHRDWRTFA